MQGTKMSETKKITNVASILDIKTSGNMDIISDLNLPEGKSIAALIYDQKSQEEDNSPAE
jgi:hypothetical protein